MVPPLCHLLPAPQASDLHSKNFVRFPAVNGSTLDITRLVSPRALEDIESGGWRERVQGLRSLGNASWDTSV